MAQALQYSKWWITINNYTDVQVSSLKALDSKYIVIGFEEAPTTGTKHLHCYVELKKRIRFNILFDKGIPRGSEIKHVGAKEVLKKISYAKKDGNFVEIGEPPVSDSYVDRGKARKEDLEKYRQYAREGKLELIPEGDMRGHYKYYRLLASEAKNEATEKVFTEKFYFPYADKLWQWQLKVLRLLQGDPDRRKIYWVYDEEGNGGKTSFALYLCFIKLKQYAQYLCPAKGADMAYALDNSKSIFILDIPRCVGDHVPWGFIEQLKNGVIFSTKYESVYKVLPTPHVFVFTNQMPPPTEEKGGFSVDRVEIIRVEIIRQ